VAGSGGRLAVDREQDEIAVALGTELEDSCSHGVACVEREDGSSIAAQRGSLGQRASVAGDRRQEDGARPGVQSLTDLRRAGVEAPRGRLEPVHLAKALEDLPEGGAAPGGSCQRRATRSGSVEPGEHGAEQGFLRIGDPGGLRASEVVSHETRQLGHGARSALATEEGCVHHLPVEGGSEGRNGPGWEHGPRR